MGRGQFHHPIEERRELVACGQDLLGEALQHLESLAGVLGDRAAGRHQQVGVGAVMAAADPASELMQLGEAEMIGAVDQDGVRGRHVDAGFDDRRADQDVEAAVIEIEHHLLEFAGAHLAVRDFTDPRVMPLVNATLRP